MPRPPSRPIPAGPPPSSGVPFRRKDTGKRNWCWAACAQMLLESNGGGSNPQCSIAARCLGKGNCCLPLAKDPCDIALQDSQITALLRCAGVKQVDFHPFALKRDDDLVRELDAGRIVQIGVSNGADSGHVVLVVGSRDVQPERQFTVHDPDRPVPFLMTFLGLKTVLGTWDATWSLRVR